MAPGGSQPRRRCRAVPNRPSPVPETRRTTDDDDDDDVYITRGRTTGSNHSQSGGSLVSAFITSSCLNSAATAEDFAEGSCCTLSRSR